MYGAIVGDIVGSVYERHNTTDYYFPIYKFFGQRNSRFTDDTVLTIATASAIIKARNLNQELTSDFFETEYKNFYNRFPDRGYGRGFRAWTAEPKGTVGESYGNGSAMRVSPVAWIVDDLDEIMYLSQLSASCSHSHAEGVKGAQAIAVAIYMARTKCSKKNIASVISNKFDYDLNASVQDLMETHSFASCQATVPPAINAFLKSEDYEDAIRKAIILGGDSDTIAAMTGSIAEAYYGGVPTGLRSVAYLLLPLSMKRIVTDFRKIYGVP